MKLTFEEKKLLYTYGCADLELTRKRLYGVAGLTVDPNQNKLVYDFYRKLEDETLADWYDQMFYFVRAEMECYTNMLLLILTCSFGKDSIATALLALQHGEPLDELVYSEVMFSDTVSGELPEHKRFIYETAIPYFEKRGIPTRVLRGQKTYLDCFYRLVSRGNAEGKLASFPLTGRCSIQRDCKLPPIRNYQKTLPQDTVYYLGIAADEPIRLARLKPNQTSLLAKYNLTENDARAMCQAEGLLSPLYAFTGRGGCWFCPNASMRELRHLYNAHPDLWQLLLELQDAPNKATERFNRSYTLRDLDLRFCLEGEQLSFFTYEER